MRAKITAVAVLLATSRLAAGAEGDLTTPAAAATPTVLKPAALSTGEVIRIAADFARDRAIDLTDFDPPRAALISAARGGKWRVFFVKKSHQMDSCFSVVVYAQSRPPRLRWCK